MRDIYHYLSVNIQNVSVQMLLHLQIQDGGKVLIIERISYK
jgi:hypothetical protein